MAKTRSDWIRRLVSLASDRERPDLRYIIRFRDRDAFRAALSALRQSKTASIRPLPLIFAISCPLAEADALSAWDDISAIEPDSPTASVQVDTGRKSSTSLPWGVNRINAPAAWKRTTGERVKIGIIDTGVDFHHPDLRNSIAGGINLVYRHLPPSDDNGHGTHVAGTIAASAKRSGVVGVAPGASLYAVKAFDYNGSAYVSDIVYAIDWCVRNRLHIINMSFGMRSPSDSLESAVKKAQRAGVIIIASSGNDGRKGMDYPARYPGVISVGATNRTRSLASFSNKSSKTDIYAPGEKIRSTWLHGRYGELSGTSMATSHVTGVVALLLSVKPGLRADEIKALLQKTSVPLVSSVVRTGHTGEIRANRAILYALRGKTMRISRTAVRARRR